MVHTTESLTEVIERSKRAALIANAEGKVAMAKLGELKVRAKVEKTEEKLGKLQEKIVAAEDAMKGLVKSENELQLELTQADEALEEAGAKVTEAEEALKAL
jgi:chromosome segregation ATPase